MQLSKEQIHEIYVKYEIMGSFWFVWVFSWINFRYFQDFMAWYFARKAIRKLKRFAKFSNQIFEYQQPLPEQK